MEDLKSTRKIDLLKYKRGVHDNISQDLGFGGIAKSLYSQYFEVHAMYNFFPSKEEEIVHYMYSHSGQLLAVFCGLLFIKEGDCTCMYCF